jgi:hypothetical protein
MDRLALRAANSLVGNPEDAALLECAFLGPELQFTADVTVAVTGAELTPKVGDAERATGASFAVRKGQTPSFAFLKARAAISPSRAGSMCPLRLVRDKPIRSAAARAASSKPATNCRWRRQAAPRKPAARLRACAARRAWPRRCG